MVSDRIKKHLNKVPVFDRILRDKREELLDLSRRIKSKEKHIQELRETYKAKEYEYEQTRRAFQE